MKQYKYGLILLVPLVLSMLFIGLNNYTSATTDNGPELNQAEIGSIGANRVFLKLQIDGNDIQGESTIVSMEREDTIECLSFRHSVTTPREATGALTGRRQHSPIVFTKMIDKSSPLLFKALANNEPITEARFWFFRPATSGSGAEEHYYTVLIENGYVSSFTTLTLTDIFSGQTKIIEEVAFIFQRITITYENGGITHQDDVRGEA